MPRLLRTTWAALALASYSLPLVMGVVAQIGHGAEHLLERVHHMQSRAAAMGVAHLHDRAIEAQPRPFVHSHGGSAHAHDGGVAALLLAADDTDEQSGESAVAPLALSNHIPAAATLIVFTDLEQVPVDAEPDATPRQALYPPPLPPPRA